jgi:adenylate kinase
MILDRLQADDCKKGWLLDGFPRNKNQAVMLHDALKKASLSLDIVIEIVLDREIAKNRIMGRRLCANDNNHPNNIFIDAIKPNGDKCRVCGGALSARNDDQDETAIDKRHSIYYNTVDGTLASAYYFKSLAEKDRTIRYMTLDGKASVKEVAAELVSKL